MLFLISEYAFVVAEKKSTLRVEADRVDAADYAERECGILAALCSE